MQYRASETFRVKTSKGEVSIRPGQIITLPDDKAAGLLSKGKIAPVEGFPALFRTTFDKLAAHLRQRDYSPENMMKLKELSLQMDQAWVTNDYPAFQKAIEEMMQIPGVLKLEGGRPQAVKIKSRVLDTEVWVIAGPEAAALVPDGEVYFLPEEIKNLRGATPEEIRTVHRVKKELGGRLVAVNMIEGTA